MGDKDKDEEDPNNGGGYYNSPAVQKWWWFWQIDYQGADDNVVDHLRADVNVNIIQEKPEVPDVEILHCGQMLHHKMGIKVVEDQNC